MKTIVFPWMLLVMLGAGCAHNRTDSPYVALTSQDGAAIASVLPISAPYLHDGPSATAWLSKGEARTLDGRVVSGIMIRTWSESGAARVQVYGMVTKPGAEAVFTTDESLLEELPLASYLLRPNQSVAITEMEDFGVKPLRLRY